MQKVVHFDFDVEDEVAAVEELPKAGLAVELARDLNVDLLGDFLQLCDSGNVDDGVRSQAGGAVA